MQAVLSCVVVRIVRIGSSLITMFCIAGRKILPILSNSLVGVAGVAPGTGFASWSAVSLCVMPTWAFTHLKLILRFLAFCRATSHESSRAQAVLTFFLAVGGLESRSFLSFIIADLLSESSKMLELFGVAAIASRNPQSSARKEEAGPMGRVHLSDTLKVGLKAPAPIVQFSEQAAFSEPSVYQIIVEKCGHVKVGGTVLTNCGRRSMMFLEFVVGVVRMVSGV